MVISYLCPNYFSALVYITIIVIIRRLQCSLLWVIENLFWSEVIILYSSISWRGFSDDHLLLQETSRSTFFLVTLYFLVVFQSIGSSHRQFLSQLSFHNLVINLRVIIFLTFLLTFSFFVYWSLVYFHYLMSCYNITFFFIYYYIVYTFIWFVCIFIL